MNDGARLAALFRHEPELTTPGDDEFITRLTDYITADGLTCGAMATRLERLKFESIVTGRTMTQILVQEPQEFRRQLDHAMRGRTRILGLPLRVRARLRAQRAITSIGERLIDHGRYGAAEPTSSGGSSSGSAGRSPGR